MFRRFSKTFNKKKEAVKVEVNGVTNAQPNGVSPAIESQSSSDRDGSEETTATRQDVQSTFEQYAQLIHAAQRPLPKQSGDGAYLEKEEPSGFWADIKALGLKDVRTVRHIMEDKASGKPQDDKQMHMEEIMQVGTDLRFSAGWRD
jgi:hypothetical protein